MVAATLLNLVMTAKAIGLKPQTYIRDVLFRIGRETDVAKLTPHADAPRLPLLLVEPCDLAAPPF